MTASRRDGDEPDEFSAWIRREPQLDSIQSGLGICDRDFWIHRYMTRNERRSADAGESHVIDRVMLLEVKSFSAPEKFSQRDTLAVIDSILRCACYRKNKHGKFRRVALSIPDDRLGRPLGARRHICCYGKHLLTMSAASPLDSQSMWWDGHQVVFEQLIGLLLFHLDPDDPRRDLKTRRHHLKPLREQELPLLRVLKVLK